MRTSGIVLAACLCLGSLLAVDAFSSGSSLNFNKNVLSAKSSMVSTTQVFQRIAAMSKNFCISAPNMLAI